MIQVSWSFAHTHTQTLHVSGFNKFSACYMEMLVVCRSFQKSPLLCRLKHRPISVACLHVCSDWGLKVAHNSAWFVAYCKTRMRPSSYEYWSRYYEEQVYKSIGHCGACSHYVFISFRTVSNSCFTTLQHILWGFMECCVVLCCVATTQFVWNKQFLSSFSVHFEASDHNCVMVHFELIKFQQCLSNLFCVWCIILFILTDTTHQVVCRWRWHGASIVATVTNIPILTLYIPLVLNAIHDWPLFAAAYAMCSICSKHTHHLLWPQQSPNRHKDSPSVPKQLLRQNSRNARRDCVQGTS